MVGVEELEGVAAGWHQWASHDGAVFVVLHGEIIGRPPR
jgi:hypothetical protein